MKYYLAFDLGRSEKKDREDRFIKINTSSFNNPGYFTKLDNAVKFTASFENYSDIILTLLERGLIDPKYIGEPLCLCYEGKEGGQAYWRNCGTKRHQKENKIIFKKDAYLFASENDEILKGAYQRKTSKEYIEPDETNTINLPFTRELLGQELYIPRVFNYENASQEEKNKFDFIEAFIKEIDFIINDMKRSSRYGNGNGFDKYVNLITSYNSGLKRYIYDAKMSGYVDSSNFDKPMRAISQMLCTKTDDKRQTYKMNNSQLYELITFYLSFYDKKNDTMANELKKIENKLQAKKIINEGNPFLTEEDLNTEYSQMTVFGEEIPLEKNTNYTRKRKR